MAKNLAVYDYLGYSPKFMRRLYWLYRFGEYNDTLNKAGDYAREHPYESWSEYARIHGEASSVEGSLLL